MWRCLGKVVCFFWGCGGWRETFVGGLNPLVRQSLSDVLCCMKSTNFCISPEGLWDFHFWCKVILSYFGLWRGHVLKVVDVPAPKQRPIHLLTVHAVVLPETFIKTKEIKTRQDMTACVEIGWMGGKLVPLSGQLWFYIWVQSVCLTLWPCENENLTRHFHSPLDDDHVLSVCRSRFLWRTHRSSWLQTSGSFWEKPIKTYQNNYQTRPYLFKLTCDVGHDVTPNSCSLCTVVFPMYCVFTLDPFGFLLRNLETVFPNAFQGGLGDYFYHWSTAGALWGLDFLGLRARLYIVHHDEPPIELDVVGLTGQCHFCRPATHTHTQTKSLL